MYEADKTIDVTGSCCPVPLIKISQAMAELTSNQLLSVTGDDPVFESGVKDYCEANGYKVLQIQAAGPGETNIIIKK